MAKEQEGLKRVELQVNANCCDGCRRKVLKALSIKGVLRTELHQKADRVAVIGDVESARLVKRLAKVGKIAEVVVKPLHEEGRKKCDDGDRRDSNHSKASPATSKGVEGKNQQKLADNGGINGSATWKGQQEGIRASTAANGVFHEAGVLKSTMSYHRAEPPMVMPMHLPYHAANCTIPPPPPFGIGGCYCPMPPPRLRRHRAAIIRRWSGRSRPGSSTRTCSVMKTPSAVT